jgi:hypothetical protein
MANGVGGRVRYCAQCHRRRCIAPHTSCAACRPRAPSPPSTKSPEVKARRTRRQWMRRQSTGVLAGFESW